MSKIKLGYIIGSHEVMILNKPVKYFYREEPDSDKDSGWRVFSGYETQEYANNPDNFSMYNAKTVVNLHPAITQYLGEEFPISYEWDDTSKCFVML